MTLLLPPLNLLLSTYLTKSILPPEEESDPPYVEDSPALFKLPIAIRFYPKAELVKLSKEPDPIRAIHLLAVRGTWNAMLRKHNVVGFEPVKRGGEVVWDKETVEAIFGAAETEINRLLTIRSNDAITMIPTCKHCLKNSIPCELKDQDTKGFDRTTCKACANANRKCPRIIDYMWNSVSLALKDVGGIMLAEMDFREFYSDVMANPSVYVIRKRSKKTATAETSKEMPTPEPKLKIRIGKRTSRGRLSKANGLGNETEKMMPTAPTTVKIKVGKVTSKGLLSKERQGGDENEKKTLPTVRVAPRARLSKVRRKRRPVGESEKEEGSGEEGIGNSEKDGDEGEEVDSAEGGDEGEVRDGNDKSVQSGDEHKVGNREDDKEDQKGEGDKGEVGFSNDGQDEGLGKEAQGILREPWVDTNLRLVLPRTRIPDLGEQGRNSNATRQSTRMEVLGLQKLRSDLKSAQEEAQKERIEKEQLIKQRQQWIRMQKENEEFRKRVKDLEAKEILVKGIEVENGELQRKIEELKASTTSANNVESSMPVKDLGTREGLEVAGLNDPTGSGGEVRGSLSGPGWVTVGSASLSALVDKLLDVYTSAETGARHPERMSEMLNKIVKESWEAASEVMRLQLHSGPVNTGHLQSHKTHGTKRSGQDMEQPEERVRKRARLPPAESVSEV